jgi:hypothetical protein
MNLILRFLNRNNSGGQNSVETLGLLNGEIDGES